MKKSFTTDAKITREINVTPIEGCNFVIYEDKTTTTLNNNNKAVSENVIYGIALYDDVVKCSNTLEGIPQKVSVPKMYGGTGFVSMIKVENLNKVLAGEMHIVDAVEYVTNENVAMDEYIPILWNPGSYKIMNLQYEFISIPIKFDDSNGLVTNEYYDLEKLLEILKNDEHVLQKDSLKIKDIPYYNRTKYSQHYISFQYLLSDEDYDALSQKCGIDVRREILSKIAKDCIIEYKEESAFEYDEGEDEFGI